MKSKTTAAATGAASTATAPEPTTTVTIPAPKMQTLKLVLRGTAPYVQIRFSEKAKNAMRSKMVEGSTAKSKKNRKPRDFDDDFLQSMYRSTEGWNGMPASAFRCALVSACRLVNFKMTLAKLSLFVLAEGFDEKDGTPLIRIHGKAEQVEHMVRNATGVADIRVRAMFREWTANLVVRYDADQFTETDVVNLLNRVGEQVGVGEGRPDSKNSCGMGWGTFTIENS